MAEDQQEKDKQFVEFIVKSIVGNPDDVNIDRSVDERGVLLTVNVNPSDIGYVIGKQGQTAKAIRTLVKVIGAKNNARVNLKISEPEGSRPPRREREEAPQGGDQGNQAEQNIDTDVVDDLKI